MVQANSAVLFYLARAVNRSRQLVAVSVERLRAAHPKLDVVVIASADHSMQVPVPPQVQMDPARTYEQAAEAVEYFAILASWLTRQAIATPLQSRLASH